MGYGMKKRLAESIRQTHAAGGLVTEVDPDAEEIGGAGGFASLASHTIFSARRCSDLAGFMAIPGNHLENIERACTNALGATNACVVNLDGVGHLSFPELACIKLYSAYKKLNRFIPLPSLLLTTYHQLVGCGVWF